MSKTKLNFIDIFSGCGGIAQGFVDAKYEFLIGVDNDIPSLNTLKHNFPDVIPLNLDLSEKVFASDIKTAAQDAAFREPVFFDMIAEFYIDLKNITAIEEVFFTRHLFNFLFFLVGCYFFYLILIKIFENKVYAYLGVLFLFFSPRIFSESFYNNKDIILLSVTIVFIFFSIKFFEKKSYLNAILFGIFSALAFVIRVPAIVYIFATYLMFFLQSLDDEKFLITNLKL